MAWATFETHWCFTLEPLLTLRECGNVRGRVLSVVATGKSYEEARQKAYTEMEKISFEGMFFRKDIALASIERSICAISPLSCINMFIKE